MKVLLLAFALMACVEARAEIRVVDDTGTEVVLAGAARRIVSHSPHITETHFAVGAGAAVVGTVAYSDYPEAAKRIPRIGDSELLDVEAVAALEPDLVVAWPSGNAERQLAALRVLGIPTFQSRPRALDEIPAGMIQLGRIAGTEPLARKAAEAYSSRLAGLRRRHASRPTVRVFYQIWDKPLMTINGAQIISDVIRLCGGENVFAKEKPLVPVVDVEAVMKADPDIVLRATSEPNPEAAFERWRELPSFRPTANGQLVVLKTDTLARQSPGILDGAQLVCDALERVRAKSSLRSR